MTRRLTTEQFVENSQKIHGGRYDYSRVIYQDAKTDIIIGCKIHGWFDQSPSNHTHKTHPKGCPKCGHQQMTGEERFWACVEKDGKQISYMETRCWRWTGYGGKRYGQFMTNGQPVLAHRFSWELHFGKITNNLNVLHKCDNPGCTNPDHLFLGTVEDNSRDMVQKGRNCRGEDRHNSKLTWKDVREIRRLWETGQHQQNELAQQFGIARPNISLIVRNKLWKE